MWSRLSGAVFAVVLAIPMPARAEDLFADLMAAIRLPDTIAIMRIEGMSYGTELGKDMLPDDDISGWQQRIGHIYDTDRMQTAIETRLRDEIADDALEPIVAFYDTDLGSEIISLELAAREAFIDIDIEDAARDMVAHLREEDDPIISQIDQLISDSDLVTFNTAGIMNANMKLYLGLAEGGALNMSEEDILSDIWAQRDDVREDSLGWIEAYFLTAYRPLDSDDLDSYLAFWRSEAGTEFNRALFAVFDRMYEELSYLLGRAAADHMQGQKL